MERTAGLTVFLALVVRTVGAATCGDVDSTTGVQTATSGGQVSVESVRDGSPAAAAGLRAGDVLTQANATVLRGCGDWTKAMRDVQGDRKALLVLVDRDGLPVPLVLPAGIWAPPAPPPAEEPERIPTAKPVFPPPVAVAPPPLPETVDVSVASIRDDLQRLAPADREPSSLTDYRRAVGQLRRAIATLAQRKGATQDVLNGLRVTLRPFEAAEVAWDAMEGERERERRMRKIPTADEATAPYFAESPAAAVIDEFPFLRVTVAAEPVTGNLSESAGAWRAVQARRLLWEHAREQVNALPAGR